MAGHIADSASVDWCTPDWIVEGVRETFDGSPDLDPCSNQWSRVGAKVEYMLPEHDGLEDGWGYKTIYVNPPFGVGYIHRLSKDFKTPKEFREVPEEERGMWRRCALIDWVERCANANINGSQVIALIPAYVDTKVWQKVVFPTSSLILFIKGRVRFRRPPIACSFTVLDPPTRVIPCPEPATHVDKYGSNSFACVNHKFGDHKPIADTAPMACALVLWSNSESAQARFTQAFRRHGTIILP